MFCSPRTENIQYPYQPKLNVADTKSELHTSGRIRLKARGTSAALLLEPEPAEFQHQYPSITLDVTISNNSTLAVVAAPNYFSRYPRPKSPKTSANTAASVRISIAVPTGWSFPKVRDPHRFNLRGLTSFDDLELCV